jgi:LDH2 family malate/lactate/ureidoglycolate dehydrogenase
VTDFAHYLKDTPKAAGFTEVFYPGEVEFNKEKDRRANGVVIEDSTWKRLHDLATTFGIAEKLGF